MLSAGTQAGLPLPYRSQARAVMPPAEELEAVPEGPCRSVLMRSRMLRSLCTAEETLPHCGLGLPGYVQVTSPIRRYTDLLAHWQLKVTGAQRVHAVRPLPGMSARSSASRPVCHQACGSAAHRLSCMSAGEKSTLFERDAWLARACEGSFM